MSDLPGYFGTMFTTDNGNEGLDRTRVVVKMSGKFSSVVLALTHSIGWQALSDEAVREAFPTENL